VSLPGEGRGALVLRFEVEVDAPPERVWAVLSRVGGWPRWHPGVGFAVLRGELARGTRLDWRGDGMRVRSVLEEVVEGRRLAWSFRTLGAQGFHQWTLESAGEDRTRVRSEEVWNGLAVRFLRGTLQRTLTVSRTAWLERLRDRAEGGESADPSTPAPGRSREGDGGGHGREASGRPSAAGPD
jgi:hypothetical protein